MFYKTQYIVFAMSFLKKVKEILIVISFLILSSCSTLESTVDSTWDSISEAGDFIYDSVNFWEEDEPEQSEAVIIEEAVEVPEYAMPDQEYFDGSQQPNFSQEQSFQTQQPYYDPIYRSQRQYYFVGPNGTPMLAPPPPPFPQYSIDQAAPMPYSYSNNLGIQQPFAIPNQGRGTQRNPVQIENLNQAPAPREVTLEEEMELFGIQNDCVRVERDYVNGGFMCDDYD